MVDSEIFPLVDRDGAVTGSATRKECHSNPSLLHPVVHCHVASTDGKLLLQLRSSDKAIQPGKWDTSVGGHVSAGETIKEALLREMLEEIGINDCTPEVLYQYIMENEIESELVYTSGCITDGPFVRQEDEVDELRWWTIEEIKDTINTGLFTPNFEDEFSRLRDIGWKGLA